MWASVIGVSFSLCISFSALASPVCVAPLKATSGSVAFGWEQFGNQTFARTDKGLQELLADGSLKSSVFGEKNTIKRRFDWGPRTVLETERGWYQIYQGRIRYLVERREGDQVTTPESGTLIVSTNSRLLAFAKDGRFSELPKTSDTIDVFDAVIVDLGVLLIDGTSLALWDQRGRHEIRGFTAVEDPRLYDVAGRMIVVGSNGIFHVVGDELKPLLAEAIVEARIFPSRKRLVLLTATGWKTLGARDIGTLTGPDINEVDSWFELDDRLLLQANARIFEVLEDGVRLVSGPDMGDVAEAILRGHKPRLFAGTSLGLYVLDGESFRRLSEQDATNVGWDELGPHQALILPGEVFVINAEDIVRIFGKLPEGQVDVTFGRDVLRMSPNGAWSLVDLNAGVSRPVDAPDIGFPTAWVATDKSVLLFASDGWFFFDGERITRRAEQHVQNVGKVYSITPHLNGYLINASEGLFASDGLNVWPIPGGRTRDILNIRLVGTKVVLGTNAGLAQVVDVPLREATVQLAKPEQAIGAVYGQQAAVLFSLEHPCAEVADQLGLTIRVLDPSGQRLGPFKVIGFEPNDTKTMFQASLAFSKSGPWTIQVEAPEGGRETLVGKPIKIDITGGIWEWTAEHYKTLLSFIGVALIITNAFVFFLAAWSATALRLATDEAWGKRPLTIAMLVLRHVKLAQLWILRLYVVGSHSLAPRHLPPFLSMPLRNEGGETKSADVALRAWPSEKSHVWLQGNAGMGKTAIFRQLVAARCGEEIHSAIEAARKFGFILVPIEARRFSASGADEKIPHGWLLAAIRDAMSERNFSLSDRSLLDAMLKSGTISVAIDGLNEVGRTSSVLAFTQAYPRVPLLITSQELGESPFVTWRLPSDIAGHAEEMLRLYLGSTRGAEVFAYTMRIGLLASLQSGYDVVLVVLLAGPMGSLVGLPKNRAELYGAFIDAAWPEDDVRLPLLQAAAWNMFSRRLPNEDKRRLKPEQDAPADLLRSLAAARARNERQVRLMRPADGGYEFVHEQMAAYLAAVWLTDQISSLAALKQELEESKIWSEGKSTQTTLWDFVALRLDQSAVEALWVFSALDDRRVFLRRSLEQRAAREKWLLSLKPDALLENAVSIC